MLVVLPSLRCVQDRRNEYDSSQMNSLNSCFQCSSHRQQIQQKGASSIHSFKGCLFKTYAVQKLLHERCMKKLIVKKLTVQPISFYTHDIGHSAFAVQHLCQKTDLQNKSLAFGQLSNISFTNPFYFNSLSFIGLMEIHLVQICEYSTTLQDSLCHISAFPVFILQSGQCISVSLQLVAYWQLVLVLLDGS